MSKIFLSHSSKDKLFIKKLSTDLVTNGYTVWLDELEIEPGEDLIDKITDGLNQSSILIFVISSNSINSGWVEKEWKIKLIDELKKQSVIVIPIKIDKCEVPKFLSTKSYADFSSDYNKGFSSLLRSLSKRNVTTIPKYDFNIIKPIYLLALKSLLSLQYPWGEWSDQRTTLQGNIAERPSQYTVKRGPEGYKPNVARTLFALESIESLRIYPSINSVFNIALSWMSNGIFDGWYKEWTSSGADDSESSIPILSKRNDIRHTSQIGTALVLWIDDKDKLVTVAKNIINNFNTKTGYWSENSNELNNSKLLSTIYSLEFLLHLKNDRFRLPLKDLLSSEQVRELNKIVNITIDEMEREIEKGNGLIGYSFRKHANPYLTGLTLFRLSNFCNLSERLDRMIICMVDKLWECEKSFGWHDYSVEKNQKKSTEARTTLRIIAGLTKYNMHTFRLSEQQKTLILDKLYHIIKNRKLLNLDSPDYACILYAYNSLANAELSSDDLTNVFKKSNKIKSRFILNWKNEIENNLEELQHGILYDVDGYREKKNELDGKINLLI